MTNFTVENAIAALSDVLDALSLPENAVKLDEAKEIVGNEMLKMMQYVFPLVMQIQIDVIKKYGFVDGRQGIVQFAQLIRSLERENPEVSRLNSLIRAYYLPPVLTTSTEAAYEPQAES